MTHIVMLVPVALNVGTKLISSGLVEALTNKGVRVAALSNFDSETIEQMLCTKKSEEIFANLYEQCRLASFNSEVVFVNSLSLTNAYAAEFNFSLAVALDAAIIFIIAADENLETNLCQLKTVAKPYQSHASNKILGVIANKADLYNIEALQKNLASPEIKIQLLSAIPFRNDLAEKYSMFYAGKTISKYFNLDWVWPFLNNVVEHAFTPTMFRHKLFSSAFKANKKIVLPEGDEPRILQAANICAVQGIARCVLLGSKEAIQKTCIINNIKLNNQIEIIDPKTIAAKYVTPLYELRKHKGMTIEESKKQLLDNTMIGTMMLQQGDVDGLVSGAVNTTANTLRPALQVIKTAPNTKLVSSIFFMCLPDQVLVYGDCALNQNPTAEELADIAIQSAKSAEDFGITPRIAMLSYSTGTSGSGPDVDKIKKATELVKQLQPNLAVDGPLQYDAAIDGEVAMLKAPNSIVAGRATVFIVPDLNVGNIVYKAVQRSTGVAAVGPMLQGLRKPVNDLSRGCSVEDVVLTIAITAVQATV